MPTLGPVTTILEAEVKQWLRNYGIVVWLDKDGTYTPYVDSLADRHAQQDFFAPVIPFRGSYLDLLFALEPYGDKLDPEPLLIHMPGHTEQTITKTPLLELYRAGTRYRRALDTLVREAATGKLPPDSIETYVSQQLSDLSEADRWLSSTLTAPADDIDHYLAGLSSEWVLDGLLGIEPAFRDKLDSPTCYRILLNYLHRQTGLDDRFRQFYLGESPLSFQALGELFAAWLLGVEYANDLTRPPHLDALKPLAQLSPPLLKTCHSLITHLRDRHPKTYIEQANAVATVLADEFQAMRPEDLGKIDTFKQEETAILTSAIEALQAGQWQKAHDWAAVRNQSQSFWLKRDRKRRLVWSLVEAAAHLGCLIADAPTSLKAAYTLREALDLYTQSGHRIDNAHRHLEQKRLKQLDTTLPYFTLLQSALDRLRALHRQWADTLAEEFTALCEREGFLPEAELQQRTLYEQVVHPLTQAKGKVAVFLIDAFRYEMAAELRPQFEGAGTQVSLKGRLAELPTLTAVGMNALAPVSQGGKLTLAGASGFGGFKTGEYTVRLPKDRARAMGERSVDNVATGRTRTLLVTLGDACTRSTEDLKRTLSPVELVVVHSKEIDDAGEAEVGLASFETWLSQIKAAWNHLKGIGIQHFVLTADHGFLLLTDVTQTPAPYGKKSDPQRRHVLTADPSEEAGSVTVSLASLGYAERSGYVLFRRDTAVFDTGKNGTFVHGGNSLQERVIPVLTISHRHQGSTLAAQYVVEVDVASPVVGLNRIRLRIRPAPEAQGVLQFEGASQISLALRVPQRDDITVLIKDVAGATVENQVILLKKEQDWAEVFFELIGAKDERVKVEVFHPDGLEQVTPVSTNSFFDVSGRGTAPATTKPTAGAAASEDNWESAIADAGARQVFIHIYRHGSITEVEIIQMLGNPRQARRFARDLETYLSQVPFAVRVESTGSGKRYVKGY